MSRHKINSIQNVINCFVIIKIWQVQTGEAWSGNRKKMQFILQEIKIVVSFMSFLEFSVTIKIYKSKK